MHLQELKDNTLWLQKAHSASDQHASIMDQKLGFIDLDPSFDINILLPFTSINNSNFPILHFLLQNSDKTRNYRVKTF